MFLIEKKRGRSSFLSPRSLRERGLQRRRRVMSYRSIAAYPCLAGAMY